VGKYLPAGPRELPGQIAAKPGGSTRDEHGRRGVSHLLSSGQISISRQIVCLTAEGYT
jgi:hypothetical protein